MILAFFLKRSDLQWKMLGGYLSLMYLENPDFTCWMCRKPRKYARNLIIHGVFLILLLKLKLLATVRLQLSMGTFGQIQWIFKYFTYQCFTIKTCTFSKRLWTRKALADSQSRVNPVNYQLNEQEVWKNSGNEIHVKGQKYLVFCKNLWKWATGPSHGPIYIH